MHRPSRPEDATLLERFAVQAALALRNATLYGEAEQRRRAAEELARMARTLSDTLDPATVGRQIVQSVGRPLRPRVCTVRLIRSDGALVVLASNDIESGHVQCPARA